jgi:hypothetical protein
MSDLLSVIDAFAGCDAHQMAESSLLSETEMLLEARSRLDGVIAGRLLAMDVREVSVAECGRQLRSWLIEEQHLAPKEAGRRLWVARRLPAHPDVAAALTGGEINAEHVQLIIGCVTKLPADWRNAAEAELLSFAREHDPGMLAALCRELRIRTGADEDAEAAAQRRYDNRFLTVATTFEGTVRVDGMLDPAAGATLQAALAPLAAPKMAEPARNAAPMPSSNSRASH